jgi:transposase
MKITTMGIDLAKTVFQIHGVDAQGHVKVKRGLKRDQLMAYFATLPPCLIGMEACGSAHHWARKLTNLGHTVRLMAPQFVKPYVKTNKNDARDAEAICEAVTRPTMRFVSVKTQEQQAVLALHRARQGFVTARTAQVNQLRGLLAEFGIVMPQGINNVRRRLPEILEDAENDLPVTARALFQRLGDHVKELDRQVQELEAQILRWHRQNPDCQKLEAIPGIGPLSATALVASIGDARNFRNGRQLAAWLGLVPRQHSSGGKSVLLGISKRGDVYLRTLLIHGARAAIRFIGERQDKTARWIHSLLSRRNKNVAAVALANKNARTVWALLTQPAQFQFNHTPA